ncbi:TIGR03087 family PEP-CTERM/XrtA system glycosyltransferase [Aurantiacibacter gangjinensis]|uniref:Uncharacterized protein n=1 Tax=Aurantiacibacter gangjinensis TaxID=502682 RepID=A0A0G9MUK5_9SPHN|nr:TIGR03087 family PEP-CTERM/XrtA system glycosyltransferase [Aurantiacibacter gangjinensis]APE28867.1 Glycosyltransferase [Aurantiacibacter gangjinensis]KLE33003.1 hypothetical protein AAW01_03080 [Aurantiacibacter gangjinensis]
MKGDILFLCHRTPFPPDRGDKIRSFNILEALSELAPVHVGCLAETDDDVAQLPKLEQFAASICMPKRSKPLPLSGAEAMLRGVPVSVAAFHSTRLSDWVREVLAAHDIAAIYVFSGQMAQYVPTDWPGRLIVDLVDVDSAKFEAYGSERRGPRSWIDRREGRLLRAVESDLVRRADVTLLVSEAEADLLRGRTDAFGDIRALRNGIDCEAFDPAALTPIALDADDRPHLVFTGQMDYAPNIQAVERMTRRIMPLVRKSLPGVQFHIVGRAPTSAVQALHGVNGTQVVGEVADVKPWLAAADMVVAPLTIARGVQNKVLEAIAMERPTIVSPEAATGIDAQHNKHICIAGDDAAFAAAIVDLANNPAKAKALGSLARSHVFQTMSWPAMLADLPQIISGAGTPAERDAA